MSSSRCSVLPYDILYQLIECGEFSELIRISHVCCQWRAVALSHPKYTQKPCIRSTTAAALERFTAQLNATPGGPLYVTVDLSIDERSWVKRIWGCTPRSGRQIFRVLAPHMSRVVFADFNVHSSRAPALFDMLQHAAPALKQLKLMFSNCPLAVDTSGYVTGHGVELPVTLFSGYAPQLKLLIVQNVRLPARPVPVFSSVDHLSMRLIGMSDVNGYSRVPTFEPARISACFPAMRRLGVRSGIVMSDNVRSLELLPTKLDRLTVDCEDDSSLVLTGMSDAALASIPFILTGDASPNNISALLCRLQGDLAFAMWLVDGEYEAVYVAEIAVEIPKLHRCFMGALALGPVSVLQATSWQPRVTEFAINQRGWADSCFVQLIPVLPTVKRLIVLLDAKGSLPLPIAPDYLPQLETVVLMTPFAWDRVQADDVRSLIATGFPSTMNTLAFEVAEGLIIEGELAYTKVTRPFFRAFV